MVAENEKGWMVALDINRKVPATASAEAVILASLNVFWSVLTKIDGRSRWNPDVSRVETTRIGNRLPLQATPARECSRNGPFSAKDQD